MTTQTLTLPESILSTEFLRLVRFRDLSSSWDVKTLFEQKSIFGDKYPIVRGKEFLSKISTEKVKISNQEEYKILGVRTYGIGAYVNRIVKGSSLTMRVYQKAVKDSLFWCKVDTKNGAFGIIENDLCEGVGSSNMIFAKVDTQKISKDYLQMLFRVKKFNAYMDSFITGTTNRKYIKIEQLLEEIQFPLPDLKTQAQIVKSYHDRINEAVSLSASAETKEKEIEAYLVDALGITIRENTTNKGFEKIRFKDLEDWSPDSIFGEYRIHSEKFEIVSFSKKQEYYLDLFRGKSPQYKDETGYFVLNQKCNRWDGIELEHAKTVDDEWLLKVNKNLLTKKGDLIINSTGEGTLGRCSLIREGFERLLCDSHMLLLRVNPQKVDARFLVKQFNAGFFQKQIDAIKSARATKQTELGVDNLLNLSFVIPPLAVQSEIIEHIEAMRVEINEAKMRAEGLRESSKREFEAELFGIS